MLTRLSTVPPLQFPDKMATVEVGCGLEGLVDAYALALEEGPEAAPRQQRYAAAIRTAVDFLQVGPTTS